jgi:putative spermidine/putrescine transport system ATP-binding protein
MSDRVAVMRNGRLVQIDAPERLYDRPCDRFVASFIGEATLLNVARAGDSAVKLGDSVLHTAHPLPRGEALLLAVQTEKLRIDEHADGEGGGDLNGVNRLRCRVTEVLYQGESLRVFATLPDGTAISLRQPGSHHARTRIPPPGNEMTVVIDPQDTIVVAA